METMPILKVAKLDDGRLAIFPATPMAIYQHIYREAAGVYWDNSLGCFHSTAPLHLTCPDWYRQVVSVVRSGIGVRLYLSPNTIFDGGDQNFSDGILAADIDVQKWIDDSCPPRP